MASGPLDRSSPLDQSKVLQEELTCPVCLDVFHDPRLLPCGHNFCKICLDRLRQLTDQSRFQCPECRESHRCNRSFQKNFKLANIAFDFRRRRRAANSSTGADASALAPKVCVTSISTGQRECVPCDYCPPPTAESSGPGTSADAGNSQDKGDMQAGSAADSNMAITMCLKCEVSMCPEHAKPHLELPAFREHPLTEPMKDFWKRKCPDHDEIFKYYCLQDEVCVCNACTVEGRHTGHTIKTLRNTMIDIKVRLHKQLNKMERKYTLAQKMLHEQSMKESANKKFLEDSDACLTRLRQDLEAKVAVFVNRLLECARTNCEAIMPTIQKNITRINQDLTRLWEVHSGIKSLMEERDAFRFIEAYKTTGKQCRKLLKKNMFDPDYVDIDPGLLAIMMEEEMQKFLNLDLTFYIFAAINSICQQSDNEEERYENEDVIREETEDAEPDEGSDHDDGSEEELSEDEEESEEEVEEGQENEGHELSDSDALYIPEQEEEEEEEEEEGQENESHELSDSDTLYIPEEEEEEESEERDEGGEEAQDEEYEDIEDGEEGRDEGGEEAQDEDYEDIEDGEEGD